MTDKLPGQVVCDTAYDSDPLDAQLAAMGAEMIAPHRKNRVNKTQDDKKLGGTKRRWQVEGFFAHVQNFRRLVVRYARKSCNYMGFLQMIAAIIIANECFQDYFVTDASILAALLALNHERSGGPPVEA